MIRHTAVPPSRALYANPTPHLELFITPAITPAHLNPCLKKYQSHSVQYKKNVLTISLIKFLAHLHVHLTHAEKKGVNNSSDSQARY